MKKFMAVGLLYSAFSVQAQVDEMRVEQQIQEKRVRPIQISAGFIKQDFKDDENLLDKIDMRGVGLGLARDWMAGSAFHTNTRFGLNILNNNGYDGERSTDIFDIIAVELEVGQEFGYNFQLNNSFTINPVLGFNLGQAMATAETLNNRIKIEQNYLKLSAVAAVNFKFSNGLTPYLKYEIASYKASGDAIANTSSGSTRLELPDMTANALSLGLSYHF